LKEMQRRMSVVSGEARISVTLTESTRIRAGGIMARAGFSSAPTHAAIRCARLEKRTIMPKTTSIGGAPATTLFARLMASIDGLQMICARGGA
jgi:hypothetical protein